MSREHLLAVWISCVLIPIAVATGQWWIIGIAAWMSLALWIMSSARFADPPGWDDVEDWWQAWLDGRL